MDPQLTHAAEVVDASPIDTESITVLVVTGADPAEVAAALGVDPAAPTTEWPEPDDDEVSGYAFAEVAGAVLAVEPSGFADPSLGALADLTRGGRRAALARSSIQGHVRFGCASDGEVVFDDHEYAFIDDADRVPAELRPLFVLAWEESDRDDDGEDWFTVALAMVEQFTGVPLTAEDLQRAHDAGYRPAPQLRYVGEG